MTTHEASALTYRRFKKQALDLMFAKPPAITPAETEIRAWLKANKERLAGRAPDEIAHLAVLCGFNVDDVCSTLANFRDAISDTYVESRAAKETLILEMTIDTVLEMRRPIELDLYPLWQDLVNEFENETRKAGA